MTVGCVWIRNRPKFPELVVATDSRLSGFGHWDACPKIFIPSRSDCILAFAGETEFAYPVILQVNAALEMHPKIRDRATHINDVAGHLERAMGHMFEKLDPPKGSFTAKFSVLFAGYSWLTSSYRTWFYSYDAKNKSFHRVNINRPKQRMSEKNRFYIWFGDDDVALEAKQRTRLAVSSAARAGQSGMDFEPLVVLRDMLREDPAWPTIGGSPQVAKSYVHMNTMPYNVRWGDGRTLFGRPLLPYERNQYMTLDPDTLQVAEWADNEGRGNPQDPLVDDNFITTANISR